MKINLIPHFRKMGKVISDCSLEVNSYFIKSSAYAKCFTNKNMNVEQYDCQKEFQILMSCMTKKIKK